jgi:hypothetical protein
MPWTEAEGWVDFEVSLNGGPFYWKGRFFVGEFRSNGLSFDKIMYISIMYILCVMYYLYISVHQRSLKIDND